MASHVDAFHIRECDLVFKVSEMLELPLKLKDAWDSPVDAEFEPTRYGATPETEWTMSVDLAEVCEFQGTFNENKTLFTAKEIYYSGEMSGSNWEHFKQLLFMSQGTLKAVVVWNEGDAFETIVVHNGFVETCDLDIKLLVFGVEGE